MVDRQIPLDKVAPWVVSGASGLYIVVRARRLSMAKPNRASLPNFLRDQSDMILMLLGGPMVWHLFHRLPRRGAQGDGRKLMLNAFHQLRQVFTALLIGTGLLMRKASEGKTAEVITLAQRLHRIVREGAAVLASVDELRLLDLVDPPGDASDTFIEHNGWNS
jgi:hypothetical protein